MVIVAPSPPPSRVLFRPSTPADGLAIHALLATAFPDDTALARYDAPFYDWKYWRPRADFPGPRSFVLTRGDDLLAHAGVVPGRCLWQGGNLNTAHMIDWAVQPGSLGAGTMLLKNIGRTCDALLAIGGTSDVRAMLPALGFRSVGDGSKFLYVLRPFRGLASSASQPGVRPLLRASRNAWRQLGAPRRPPRANWRARRLIPADLADPRWQERQRNAPTSSAAAMERSAVMLEHLLACPATPIQVYGVEQTDGPGVGYFVLSRAGGQARLADCQVSSQDPGDWSAIVALAIEIARQEPRSTELLAVTNQPTLSTALVEAGFWRSTPQPVLLRTRPGIEFPLSQLQIQMADRDMVWMPGVV